MSYNIAVAGKGGSGKTSTACLVIRYLLKNKPGPILAVDADANANLGDSLGLEIGETVGQILNEFQGDKIKIPSGMTKQVYLEYKLNEIVVESKGLDLVTMGRGEGAECYCYPNVILRKFVDGLAENYTYTVLDNEAGMEHLSRGTTQNINDLLIISNYSVKGIRAVARIRELVSELQLGVDRQSVIITSAPSEFDPAINDELARLNLEPTAIIPFDEEVRDYDIRFRPLVELPDTSKAVMAVNDLMNSLLNKN